jgi:hypothetical protein
MNRDSRIRLVQLTLLSQLIVNIDQVQDHVVKTLTLLRKCILTSDSRVLVHVRLEGTTRSTSVYGLTEHSVHRGMNW